MNHPKVGIDPYFFVSAAINLFIAWKFFQLWTNPGPDDAANILGYATLMAFEFVMVHSGVFMAVFSRKKSMLLFVPFYGLFALAFNTMMPNNEILYIYMFAVLGRMRFAFMEVSAAAKTKLIMQSVAAAMIYFVLVFVVAFGAPLIPALGVNPEFLDSIGYLDGVDASGIFIDTPQTALAFGTVYYVVITIVEYWIGRIDLSKLDGMMP